MSKKFELDANIVWKSDLYDMAADCWKFAPDFDSLTNSGIREAYSTEMPGCCGVIVLHEATPQIAGPNLRAWLHSVYDEREGAASALDYGYALVTTQVLNHTENVVLRARGYKVLARFQNPRTGNCLILWGKRVLEAEF
jgi:hypothetical protein